MSADVSAEPGRMTLVEHLTELRSRLIKSVLAVAIGALVGFFLYGSIFDALLAPYKDQCEAHPGSSLTENCALLQADPLEGFSVRMKISLYAGIALAMPVLLWQLWRFISPGLYKHERRYAIPFVVSALLLFTMGAALAYFTLPKALDWLRSIGGGEERLVTAYTPSKYFRLISYYMLSFGVGFEFPVLLVFLQMVGILKHDVLSRYRRHAIVGITILVAVITPSGDPITMLVLTVPMVLFYEASILIGRLMMRRRTANAEA